jgi:hypothetical protein
MSKRNLLEVSIPRTNCCLMWYNSGDCISKPSGCAGSTDDRPKGDVMRSHIEYISIISLAFHPFVSAVDDSKSNENG